MKKDTILQNCMMWINVNELFAVSLRIKNEDIRFVLRELCLGIKNIILYVSRITILSYNSSEELKYQDQEDLSLLL